MSLSFMMSSGMSLIKSSNMGLSMSLEMSSGIPYIRIYAFESTLFIYERTLYAINMGVLCPCSCLACT